jgi:uncharacterized protein (DUF1330 family)
MMAHMREDEAGLHLCCLLWAHPGTEQDLVAYEDTVLGFFADHGGQLLSRVIGDGSAGHPLEVHVYRFPDQAAIDAYIADPRRLALSAERERVVARTELFPVRPASPG